MGKAIRKALLAVGLLALMAGLLRHSGPVGEAVRQGIALCGRSVIPSLFPFFVTVSFAVACGFFSFLRQLRLPGRMRKEKAIARFYCQSEQK